MKVDMNLEKEKRQREEVRKESEWNFQSGRYAVLCCV